MPKTRGTFSQGIGERLASVRRRLNYSRQEMARVLGLKSSGYFKNESGETFLSVTTMSRLQKNYDISIDWLLFNKGPMYFKDKPSQEKPTLDFVSQSQELGELMTSIEQDPQLRHEILAYFYQYKSKKKPTE
jgi:transcriptional regulator with XRE-family HTH domain